MSSWSPIPIQNFVCSARDCWQIPSCVWSLHDLQQYQHNIQWWFQAKHVCGCYMLNAQINNCYDLWLPVVYVSMLANIIHCVVWVQVCSLPQQLTLYDCILYVCCIYCFRMCVFRLSGSEDLNKSDWLDLNLRLRLQPKGSQPHQYQGLSNWRSFENVQVLNCWLSFQVSAKLPTLSTLLVNRSWSKLIKVNPSLSKLIKNATWRWSEPPIKIQVYQWIKPFRSTLINFDQSWLTKNVYSATFNAVQ